MYIFFNFQILEEKFSKHQIPYKTTVHNEEINEPYLYRLALTNRC